MLLSHPWLWEVISQEQEPGRFCADAQGDGSHGSLPQRYGGHCLCRQCSPSLHSLSSLVLGPVQADQGSGMEKKHSMGM